MPTSTSCTAANNDLAPFGAHIACPYAADHRAFVDSQASSSEKHMILDFTLGKDVGLGSAGTGTFGAGIRIAQFATRANADLNGDPLYHFPATIIQGGGSFSAKYGYGYNAITKEKRSFHGIGPELTWDASLSVFGSEVNGDITIDWGANAALLFGRQSAKLHHEVSEKKCGHFGHYFVFTCSSVYDTPADIERLKRVTVPNLGGYVGASVRYQHAKISFGYRVDEFFNAMDGGQDEAKSYNRGFYGPYLNLSIGFGG